MAAVKEIRRVRTAQRQFGVKLTEAEAEALLSVLDGNYRENDGLDDLFARLSAALRGE